MNRLDPNALLLMILDPANSFMSMTSGAFSAPALATVTVLGWSEFSAADQRSMTTSAGADAASARSQSTDGTGNKTLNILMSGRVS
jgi:hypothetical protein